MPDSPGEKDNPQEIEEITVELLPGGEPRMGRVYANYVIISHSPWDINVRFCLAPAGSDIKKAIKEDTNTVEVPIIIDVMLPPALIPGFIKALQTHFEKFEKKLAQKSLPAGTDPTTH
jgi:hypothetical protein